MGEQPRKSSFDGELAMGDKIYIHFGAPHYEWSKFKPIISHPFMSKPAGGLWGSDINSPYGWKDWCKDEDFMECIIANSFRFKLKNTAKVEYIDSVDKAEALYRQYPAGERIGIYGLMPIDYQAMIDAGIDAVEVSISSDNRLYSALYGWDCDSICVMNPDVLILEGSMNHETD